VRVKAEHTDKGSKPRFVVTNLEGGAQKLYDELYCARGEMEHRLKEQPVGLLADRTSGHGWGANPFRLLWSSCASVLLERLRALALAGTELARAQVGTIRRKLLKIGAAVLRHTRRVRLRLSRSYPYQAIFRQVVAALASGCSALSAVPGTRTNNGGKGACARGSKKGPSSPSPESGCQHLPAQNSNRHPDEICGLGVCRTFFEESFR